MSSSIQTVSSAPSYISEFIAQNMTQLQDIYEEGIHTYQSGCVLFVCSKEENKMDVQFQGDEQMCEILQQDSWVSLKNGIPSDKKLFVIRDTDLNSVFLIYV
jgi:hypothetical protein